CSVTTSVSSVLASCRVLAAALAAASCEASWADAAGVPKAASTARTAMVSGAGFGCFRYMISPRSWMPGRQSGGAVVVACIPAGSRCARVPLRAVGGTLAHKIGVRAPAPTEAAGRIGHTIALPREPPAELMSKDEHTPLMKH